MSTEQFIKQIKHEVENHPKGQLILPLRKKLYKYIGEHKIRINLAILCSKKVLPIWNSVLTDDTMPSEILKCISEYMSGTQTKSDLMSIADEFWTKLETYMCEDEYSEKENYDNAIYAGFTLTKASYVVLYDEKFDEYDETILDEDLDAYTWDTAYFASLAYCENELFDELTKIQKRKEFWLWYLDIAIPEAMQI